MNVQRVLSVAGIVCALLLGAALGYGPVSAAALPDDPEPQGEVNRYCGTVGSEEEPNHPVGNRIAETFDVSYETVMGWFCDEQMGFGRIMLALTTAQASDDVDGAAEYYLDERAAGMGWGQIWQGAGLIGRGRTKDDGQSDGVAPPQGAGQTEDLSGRGNRGNSNGVGPGENRGLHLGADKPKGGNRP